MEHTVHALADRIGATVRGDAERAISGCAGLEEAGPSDLSFLANQRYTQALGTTKAGAVVVSKEAADGAGDDANAAERALLVADDPYFAFREAVVAIYGFRQHPGLGVSDQAVVDPTATIGDGCVVQAYAVIAAGAKIGERCVIYPHCYVGPNAVIGDDCILYPSVTVYDDCVLGDRVTLQAGCVIGQDGFGYATHAGAHHKIPQVGNVVIEDDVEMGAGCAIDRATVGSTVIGQGTKFSDLIAIGHGTRLGKHNLLVAQVGLAGSVKTGDYVVMGGQVGVAGHLNIADMVKLAAKSGVMTDINEKGAEWGGQPAMPLTLAKRNVLALSKLGDMAKEFRRLQKRVAELEAKLAEKE